MSKKEKLAAFIEAVVAFDDGPGEWTDVMRALIDYQDAPDDPPPKPEMPECVATMLMYGEGIIGLPGWRELRQQVRDYYRQPLKLEAGKCYEDTDGNAIDIVWHDPKVANHFVGVVRMSGEPVRYLESGRCTEGPSLIREVTNG